MRLNNSSTQVYMALKPGEVLDESLRRSAVQLHRPAVPHGAVAEPRRHQPHLFVLLSADPARQRPLAGRLSTNARYEDWADLSPEEYEPRKRELVETTLDAIDKYVPDIRQKLDHVEASTPLTFRHYTRHLNGASFGTKFEGLAVSRAMPEQVAGLYHAGSVGIIMSGWLGAMNYGVIVANDVDAWLMKTHQKPPLAAAT